MNTRDGTPLRWQVVVSAKRLDLAKSRLAGLGDPGRRALAAAMAEDVIDAVVSARSVARTVFVCDDPALVLMARSHSADVVCDPGRGLNEAFRHGARSAASATVWTCLLTADLPCLTSDTVDSVLDAAARHERAVIPDLSGRGTTLLTSAPWLAAQPQFGHGSFQRHVLAGAQPIALNVPRMRCDVDTPDDLRRALRLGTAWRTAAAAGALGEQERREPV